MEGARGALAVRRRIGEGIDDLQLFDDRSGPSVRDDGRQFLTKPFGDEVLLGAIRSALERSRATLGRQAEIQALREVYALLTPREREVMALVVSGLLNKRQVWPRASARLYQLIRQGTRVVDRTFEIKFLDPGVRAFVFTFG